MSETSSDRLNKFFRAWQDENLLEMFKHCQLTWADEKDAEPLRVLLNRKPLKWRVQKTKRVGPACQDLMVNVTYQTDHGKVKTKNRVRLICERAPYSPGLDGTWGVNPVSIREI